MLMVGTGEYEADWGVTSDTSNSSSDNDQSTRLQTDFAPPNRVNRKFMAKELRPLVIVNENISRTAKFYNLFTVRPSRKGLILDFLFSTCSTARDKSILGAAEVDHMYLTTPLGADHSESVPCITRGTTKLGGKRKDVTILDWDRWMCDCSGTPCVVDIA
jgi:hypothetical protein